MGPERAFVVRGARVFDGAEVLAGADVLVRDGRIAAVGKGLPASRTAGLPVVDGHGRTLLPGLIDAHVHAFPGARQQATAFGVTTQLDMFNAPGAAAALRAASAHDHGGCDIRSAGTGATAPGGYPWWLVERGVLPPFPTVAGAHEAVRFVADRVAEGSDYLKVIVEDGSAHGTRVPHLDAATITALVGAAHARGRLAVAHISTLADARLAVRAGADVLGHVFTDTAASADFARELRCRGTAVVPTLVMLAGAHGDDTGHGPHTMADALARDPRICPYLDERSRSTLAAAPVRPDGRRLARALCTVGVLHAAGVPIVAGTDAPNPGTAYGVSLHAELELLVRAGLTPVAALAAATSVPAGVFQLRGRGRISPGGQADLLLVAGDPTADITALRDITAVWRHGARADRRTVV